MVFKQGKGFEQYNQLIPDPPGGQSALGARSVDLRRQRLDYFDSLAGCNLDHALVRVSGLRAA